MKISIAMATCNGAKYIQEQLDSFARQSVLPQEIVISDDNSIDNTLEIIEKFARIAPFKIKILNNKKRLGYAANFNRALLHTDGNFVFLSDQDDVWYSHKIEYMIKLSEIYPDYHIYMNDALLTDSDLNSVNLTKYGQIKSGGYDDTAFVMGCCCLIKRELLDIALPIPPDYIAHDNWLVSIADGLNTKFIADKVLQYYRRHESNESQFIVNRLTKINKIDKLKETLKLSFTTSKEDVFEKQIQQLAIYINDLEKRKSIVPIRYAKLFDNHLEDEKNKLKLMSKRQKIRNKNIMFRIVLSVSMCFTRYKKGTKFKNMIRDIIG